MDTFKRYFAHFLLVIVAVAIILIIVVRPPISRKSALLYFCIVLFIFVIPMSLFFSNQESTITLNVPCNSEVVYKQILAVIENEIGRVLTSQNENTLVYSIPATQTELFTKYRRWLTNDITVIKHASTVEIVTPRYFQKHFNIFNAEIMK